MNECPTCGRKLRGDTCPYCDEELVQDGSEDSTPVSGESLVVVFRCDQEWQADFVISALEAEGIRAFRESSDVVDDHASDDQAGDWSGDIAIMVEEEDTEKAIEIVDAAQHDLDAGEH
jgi:hypothetical protein